MDNVKVVKISEKEATRLVVDDIVGELDLALERVEYLNNLMWTGHLAEDWSDLDIGIINRKQRELFLISSMMSDFISDIRDARDELKEKFEL